MLIAGETVGTYPPDAKGRWEKSLAVDLPSGNSCSFTSKATSRGPCRGGHRLPIVLRRSHRLLLGTCLVSASLTAAFAQNRTDQSPKGGQMSVCALSVEATPRGLAVVLPSGDTRDQSLDLQALNNPYTSGVEVQMNWRDIEPVQGQLNWSRLDTLLAAAEASGKWVQLAIFPGFFSPAWALAGVKTEAFAIQYGPGQGTVAKLPMPWDRVYLDRWFAFVRQLAERYGRSPAFQIIAA